MRILNLLARCGLIFLSTLFSQPLRVRRRIHREDTSAFEPAPGRLLRWIAILSGLASFSSLVCLAMIALVPNIMYVPWPRPYMGLLWWQFALLSLPFASLVLALGIAVLAGPSMKNQTNRRGIHFYYLIIALALLIFNLVLII